MKILFLCHRFPLPADGGGKIRALHIVRHLVAAGHAMTVCSLVRSAEEAAGALALAGDGVRVEAVTVRERTQRLRMCASLAMARPISFAYFFSPELAKRVDSLLRSERFDLIFAHCSSMAPYVINAAGIPKVMDFADMDSRKWLEYARHKSRFISPLFALEGRRVEAWETRIARNFDLCTVISPIELASLRELRRETRAEWFPNGVDLEYFRPAAEAYDPDLVAFIGRMDYFPNADAMRWFCAEVWPRLRSQRPTTKLKIIGASPPKSVRLLDRLPGVEVTGFVPDVRPHLASAAVAIAPLTIARGLQNKVLECLALGIPVVSSKRVAINLEAGSDSPLRVCESAEEYEREIVEILRSKERRGELANQSRQFVETRFSWSTALDRLDRSVESLMKTREFIRD